LNHQFNAWFRLYALGLRTRLEVATAWDLQGAELTQADLLADEIDAIGGNDAKLAYVLRVDAVAMLLDSNDPTYVTGTTINKTLVQTDLGI
jgi:methylthioribose-1-phosphate isomerase